jgi:hypothetical protein
VNETLLNKTTFWLTGRPKEKLMPILGAQIHGSIHDARTAVRSTPMFTALLGADVAAG